MSTRISVDYSQSLRDSGQRNAKQDLSQFVRGPPNGREAAQQKRDSVQNVRESIRADIKGKMQRELSGKDVSEGEKIFKENVEKIARQRAKVHSRTMQKFVKAQGKGGAVDIIA